LQHLPKLYSTRHPDSEYTMTQAAVAQILGFQLRIARTDEDLRAACQVRSEAYGRHLPQMKDTLLTPDAIDSTADACVLLCTDKRSGAPIGTLRLQTSFGGPLLIEHSVPMPPEVLAATRVELTRLAVTPGADPLVKLALMKASFLYCRAAQVQLMVIGARSRALVRLYERLHYSELFGAGATFALKHAGDLPHRVLVNDLRTLEQRWRAVAHEWLGFMVETSHPDIDLGDTLPAPVAPDFGLPLAA
jgi:hypothetical protein